MQYIHARSATGNSNKVLLLNHYCKIPIKYYQEIVRKYVCTLSNIYNTVKTIIITKKKKDNVQRVKITKWKAHRKPLISHV